MARCSSTALASSTQLSGTSDVARAAWSRRHERSRRTSTFCRDGPILRFTDETVLPMDAGSVCRGLRPADRPVPGGGPIAIRPASSSRATGGGGDPLPGEASSSVCRRADVGVELRRWQSRPEHQRFSAPGRLARVGLRRGCRRELVDVAAVAWPRARRHRCRSLERYDAIRRATPGRLPRPGRREAAGSSSTTCSSTR